VRGEEENDRAYRNREEDIAITHNSKIDPIRPPGDVSITPDIIPTDPDTHPDDNNASDDNAEVNDFDLDGGCERRIRKPSQKVLDLLEGHGMWSDETDTPVLPPGVQLVAERLANDEKLTDWLDDVPAPLEGYVFTAGTSESEALEPRSLTEAKGQPDWLLWEKAIEEELATLRVAGTWELEKAPEGANMVGSKWVFRAKRDATGKVI
jgi:hypothetical protein